MLANGKSESRALKGGSIPSAPIRKEIMLNINYSEAIDFGHCDTMNEARAKLSELTNLLNQVIIIRQGAKKDILEECGTWKGENLHKLSWDNKMVRLSELSGSSELTNLWQEADMAYKQIKNKQDQVFEDLMAIKKIMDVTPN